MNPYEISGGAVQVLSLGLRRPFITALGKKTFTRNATLRLDLRGGGRGFGEASTSLASKSHSAARLAADLRGLLRRFAGRDARCFGALSPRAWEAASFPEAAAAFECALLDALTRQLGLSLAHWFGGSLERLATDLTLSAGPADETAEAAREAAAQGFRTLKVKVGAGGPRQDLARVLAAHEHGGKPAIILDGNQRLSLRSALALSEACLKRGVRLKLIEQPLPRASLKEMAALTRRSSVPVAADESVRSSADARKVLDLGAADVINVKVAKTGIQASLDIIALARAAGKGLMIGCMEESMRGLSPSVHLALGTGAFAFVDLDSDCLLGPGQPRGDYVRRGPLVGLS